MERLGKRERTRALLIATTEELLQNHSLSEITMEMVAEEAGLVASTVYNHFPSKSALLAAATEEVSRQVSDALKAAADRKELNRLIPVLIAMTETLRANQNLSDVIWTAVSAPRAAGTPLSQDSTQADDSFSHIVSALTDTVSSWFGTSKLGPGPRDIETLRMMSELACLNLMYFVATRRSLDVKEIVLRVALPLVSQLRDVADRDKNWGVALERLRANGD